MGVHPCERRGGARRWGASNISAVPFGRWRDTNNGDEVIGASLVSEARESRSPYRL